MGATKADINMGDPHATALRVAIARVGVSSAELARRLGRPGRSGEAWVRRRTHGQTPPTARDLDAIARALGCPVRELLPAGGGTNG